MYSNSAVNSMPKEKKTQYALLGLLVQSPLSGYDMKKLCDKSIGYFWNENYSNIYPVLKAMKKDGLVTMEVEKQVKSPDRKVYTITDLGIQTLQDWLKRQPEHRHLREELLLQVGFGFLTDKGLIIAKLKKRIAECTETIEQLMQTSQYLDETINTAIEAEQNSRYDQLPYLYMKHTLSFGIKFYQMEMDWCADTIESLNKMG